MMPALHCPRCGSSALARLAKNDISPFRGYRCEACGRRLRDRGSLPLYFVAMTIGLLMLWAFGVTFDMAGNASNIGRTAVLGMAGLIGAGYAMMEIARPTPQSAPPGALDAADNWSVARNGENRGPFTFGQMRQMAESGAISPADMVFDPTANGWTSAGLVGGLFIPGAQVSPPDKTGV